MLKDQDHDVRATALHCLPEEERHKVEARARPALVETLVKSLKQLPRRAVELRGLQETAYRTSQQITSYLETEMRVWCGVPQCKSHDFFHPHAADNPSQFRRCLRLKIEDGGLHVGSTADQHDLTTTYSRTIVRRAGRNRFVVLGSSFSHTESGF